MMKLDLKKELKELYKVSGKEVAIVKVPQQKIISIIGKGNPNTSIDFKNAVEALFPVAYKIKFTYKKSGKDYAVMPLEGLWWAENMNDFSISNKDNWQWKIFIVQPDFVSKETFDSIIDDINKEKNLLALGKVKFETLSEGISAQILHLGSFANEGPTINKLHDFIKEKGYSFDGLVQKHHEIYLSDIRKTPPQKLKTILRQPVKNISK
ncbi:MAG: hypothetical protein AUK06_01180 [Parcubacteria group bacterium CG2_30_36_18]|uniref:GyrI-like small molecule binding domain-containing protein n=1 Tax=Candidatus Kuenenbacteria bacterium CG_4_10_14_3_um_filter_39_14 TaxID=1974614 RepID=A0A2M7MG74_9BACT|nr:MAG: hypothetical protein AUK06_01180 [Parcubacteria group bacterium CG2_30_36_18]PIX92096.1 MAG: hypothetical protein COZ26_03660 [Candidatus Kuenenbacteria bacterium CG_4_10_14_3_um_filter_39_14]